MGGTILVVGANEKFGLPFIANTDPVERPRRDAPVCTRDRPTFSGEGARRHTDHPALAAAERP